MYKYKNKVNSTNFLDANKSTYSNRKKIRKPYAPFSVVITALIITIITVGVIDNSKVSADEIVYNNQQNNTQQVDNNQQGETQKTNQSVNANTVYIKEKER